MWANSAYLGFAPRPTSRMSDREITIGWTSRLEWAPWGIANELGITKRWADRYGLNLQIVQFSDYQQSMQWFAEGRIDGFTAMTIDANQILVKAKRQGVAIIVGSFSDGSDAIVSKRWRSIQELRGQRVHLHPGFASEYLLQRALEKNGMFLSDVKLVPMTESNPVDLYSTPAVETMVSWNPWVGEAHRRYGGKILADSSFMPGELSGALILDPALLEAYPGLGEALTGIWYETLSYMSQNNVNGAQARKRWADVLGLTQEQLATQLAKIHMYLAPSEVLQMMDNIDSRSPIWNTGLDVALKFDRKFMELASDKKLRKSE